MSFYSGSVDYEVLDYENKTADYANIRATDIPTVQRLFPPKPASMRREIVMQNMKDKMLMEVKRYKEKNCNSKGWIKEKNLSKQEEMGLLEVTEKIRNKEMVVFTSDKTGVFTADTVQNYGRALEEHTSGDTVISNKRVKDIEKKMNFHLKQLNKMFRVGSTWGHEARVAGAFTSTNVPPPNKYGLRKDHKTVPPEQEKFGPPLRPVAGADQAPNSRLSHFLSRTVNDYSDCENSRTKCRSCEEMRAALETFNKYNIETRTKCRIISMDVKALYPSMGWSAIVSAVKEMIENSNMQIQNVDWHEVGCHDEQG